MLIILEGPDGSGKSFLAERLISRIQEVQPNVPPPEYVHKKKPTEDNLLDEYMRPVADYLPRSNRTVICDRWHLGELVYPEMTDRQTLATDVEMTYLEMFLRSRGALVVYVDTDTTTILQAIENRYESDVLETRVLEQHAGFSRALKATNLRTYTYDRSQDVGGNDLVDTIIAQAATAEIDVPDVRSNPTYVGPVRPAVVLIGDRRNTDEFPTAFVPRSATSGHYLLNALPDHWRRYNLVGFINANEGHIVDIFEQNAVKPNYVVLGREAEKSVRGSGEIVEFGVIPHPQYIRRFHHHARDYYGNEIMRVARTGEDHSSWRP